MGRMTTDEHSAEVALPRVTLSEAIGAVYRFARHPTPERWSQQEARRWFLPLFWLSFVVARCVAPFTAIMIVLLRVRMLPHHSRTSHAWEAILIAPLLEETTYRLMLRFGKARFAVGMGAFVSLTLVGFSLVPKAQHTLVFTTIALASLLGYGLLWIPGIHRAVFAAWHRFFPHLVWASTLVFATSHIFNYNLYAKMGAWAILTPLLVVSQFFGGWILAFTRVRFGIGWSMLQHGLFNGTSELIKFLETRK